MMYRIASFLLSFAFCANLYSQSSQSAADILQSLQKLNVVGSVLYIAAHPDDENTRLLTYLVKERKFETAYLSLTRGDGGQNLIGTEQGYLLGMIRTQELLAARRIDGAKQFFTRANDFGYSKNPEETFEFWNKDSILKDVVLCIRKFKPDIIICRFPTTGEGGHGHHTASAILAQEAFEAAANPNKFPEQLTFTKVWQAKRLFWNTFNFGGTNTTSPNQLKIDVGVYNSLIGKNYGEIAAESRSMHKSQGFGSAKQRGSNIEFFKLLKGDSVQNELMQHINTTWTRFEETKQLPAVIETIIKNYNPVLPQNSVNDLIKLYKNLSKLKLKDTQGIEWQTKKLSEIKDIILALAGVWLEATATDYFYSPGSEINITLQAIARNSEKVFLQNIISINGMDTLIKSFLKKNELTTFKKKETVSNYLKPSNPYWLNGEISSGIYTVDKVELIGKPENAATLKVKFTLQIEDLEFEIERDICYKWTDPVKGELYRPIEILPPLTINSSEKNLVFTGSESKIIRFNVKANKSNVSGELKINVGEGFNVNIPEPNFNLKNKGDEVVIEAIITSKNKLSKSPLKAYVNLETEIFNQSITRLEYDHIPQQFVLTEAKVDLIDIDIKRNFSDIAYIPGAGDNVASCLKQIGFNVTILNDADLATTNLSSFKAIVTGIRAFNTSNKLTLYQEKLMDYVKNGGNLLVQYNTNSRVGPLQTRIGPYPFNISRDRVTDELSEVIFINPNHAVLKTPNIISKNDFDNWVQERGIYFATELSKEYETVFLMKDKNETPHSGSVIIAKHGKGNFIYTGLSFFRQLPNGVPGAYRLFVNLLSLPAQP